MQWKMDSENLRNIYIYCFHIGAFYVVFFTTNQLLYCFMRWHRWMAWRGLPTTNSFTRHSVSWAHLPNLLPSATNCDPFKKEKRKLKWKTERKRLNCLSRYHSSVTESWVRFQTKIQSPSSLQLRRSPSSFGCFTQSFSFEIPSFCKDQ